MKTDKATVFDLFEKQRRYLVPLFQRGYVWQRTTQWEPLWQDILDQTGAFRQNGKRASQYHFLGAIVLNQVPTMIRQTPASEIIDGQQRLLTLQVLLIALRDVATAHGSTYTQATLDRLTTNPGPYRDPDEEFKVWPTNAYRRDLQIIKKAGNAPTLSKQFPQIVRYRKLTPPRPPLVDAYLYFAGAVSADLSSPENIERQQEALDELTEVIIRHLQLVSIELDIDDHAQVIFETLNARGVPLEPADLVRNFIFLYATRQEEDVEDLYEKYWKEFDEKTANGIAFWREKERQGRLTRTRLDLFFFHYITCRTAKDINVSHLFQEFRTWWNESPRSSAGSDAESAAAVGVTKRNTSEELSTIHDASTIYRQLIQPTGDSRFDLFARRVKALDTTTMYPLVLWLREHQQAIGIAEFEGIFQDLESYLIRRMICGLTTKNYNRIFLNVLTNLQTNGTPSRANLQSELINLTGDTGIWPDDQTVTNQLLRNPIYGTLNQARVRVLLEGIERAQRTTKHESIPIPDSLSIEHVLPQTDDPTVWPYPPDTAPGDTPTLQKARVLREVLKHTIGNLTLVTQPLNSSVSCGPFKDKRPAITSNSLLTLNAYFQRFMDSDAWDERAIFTRSNELAAILLAVWPRPNHGCSKRIRERVAASVGGWSFAAKLPLASGFSSGFRLLRQRCFHQPDYL